MQLTGREIRQISYIAVVATVLLLTMLVIAGFVYTGQAQSIVQHILESQEDAPEPDAPVPAPRESTLFALTDLDNHPDFIHGEYTAAPLISLDDHLVHNQHLSDFRDLLGIYVSRQSMDDNFTVRVIDRRTSGLLERYTMENLSADYAATGVADWEAIDAMRGTWSSKLIGKYRRRGVPMEDIMIKWGRLDQVKEARVREEPFISYEIRLSTNVESQPAFNRTGHGGDLQR